MLAAVAVAVAGCGGQSAPPKPPPVGLAEAATVHLRALARIGERHGQTRAAGTAGYDASVDYVAGRLRAAGYRVRLQEVPFPIFRERSAPRLEVGGRRDPGQVAELLAAGARPGGARTGRSRLRRGRLRRRPRPDRARRARGLHVPREGAARPGGGRSRAGGGRPRQRVGAERVAGPARHPHPRGRHRRGRAGAARAGADGGRHRGRDAAHPQRDRRAARPGGAPRGDARRAPRLRARGPGHQRQRQRGGRRARAGGAAARPPRPALRLLGRRGARPLRLARLRRLAQRRRAAADRRLHQPRHGRLAQSRALRLRRGPGARGARAGAAGAQAGVRRDHDRRVVGPRAVRGRRDLGRRRLLGLGGAQERAPGARLRRPRRPPARLLLPPPLRHARPRRREGPRGAGRRRRAGARRGSAS